MNWVRKLSLATTAGILLSMAAHAQVPIKVEKLIGSYGSPTITSSGDACLTYTSGVADNRVYTFGGVTLGSPTYSWSTQGGLAIVGSATGTSVTVKAAAGLKRPYPKGRLTLFYKGTIDSTITVTSCPLCNGNPVTTTTTVKIPKSGTIYIDTYQKFDHSEQIVGNVCVSAGDSAAYSIKDLLTGNPGETIGSDTYFWTPNGNFIGIVVGGDSRYVSGDSSAITYKFSGNPVPTTTYTINVTVGKCNVGGAGKLKTKTLAPKVPPALTSPLPKSTTCLAVGTTTYSITNTVRPGITYTWSKSNDNWLYTSGTSSTSQAGITLNVGAQAGTVYITSTASTSAYCGTTTDTIRINRSLTGATISTIPATTCFTPGVAYSFQITPAPSAEVVWTVPAGWTVDPANINAPSVTITAGSVGGSITAVSKGCSGATNTFTASIAPAQPVITGTACVARGSAYTFSTPAIAGASSYNWVFPSGWTWTPLNANSVTATVGASGVSGNVTVTAVGCSNNTSAPFTATILPPKPGTVTFTPSTCVNRGMADTLTFSVSAVTGVTYQWVLPAGWSAGSNVTPFNSYVVYPNGVAGSYYVKVRGLSMCNSTTNYSAYDSVLVTINGIGSTVTISKSPIDQDGNGTQDGEGLSVAAVASPVKYQWYNASGPIIGETTRFLDLLNAGSPNASYYIRVSKNGCQTQANTTSSFAYRTSGPSAADLMAQVKVYPIPTSDEVTIELPFSYEEAAVDFVDMAGVNVLTKTLRGKSVTIPVASFNAGSYYARFTIDGATFSKKIVVVK